MLTPALSRNQRRPCDDRVSMLRLIHRFSHLLAALLSSACLFASGPSWAFERGAEITPLTLVRAFDGDSMVLRHPERGVIKARLAGIDAPEKAQPFGVDARKRLEAILASGRVSAKALKLDGFGRWIVTVEVDGQDLGETLIREGLAWYFRKYERDLPKALRPRYEAAETQARKSKRGLWVHEDPLAPWAYRQKRSR
ncbi:MAG: hypothetical protein RL320_1075 [Pseudomonadota bacterium]